MLNKILQLNRPLAILDCETTGLTPEVDRIIQIGVTIHYPDKECIVWNTLINPEIPILNDQHGLKDEHVKDFPPFREHAPSLAKHLLGADIGGYNVVFDIAFIKAEMKRAVIEFDWNNHVIDALQIYRFKRGHTLSNAYLEYGGENGTPTSTPFENAHDAGADVRATEIVLRGQLLRHANLPRTVKELAGFCFPHPINALDKTGKFVWAGTDAAINFGKHRGTLLKNLNRGYLKWITMGDFSDEVKDIAQDALDGEFPVKS